MKHTAWVIRCYKGVHSGEYVERPEDNGVYTKHIGHAEVYRTREEAKRSITMTWECPQKIYIKEL